MFLNNLQYFISADGVSASSIAVKPTQPFAHSEQNLATPAAATSDIICQSTTSGRFLATLLFVCLFLPHWANFLILLNNLSIILLYLTKLFENPADNYRHASEALPVEPSSAFKEKRRSRPKSELSHLHGIVSSL